jgi:hypothetical protein
MVLVLLGIQEVRVGYAWFAAWGVPVCCGNVCCAFVCIVVKGVCECVCESV